MINKKLKRTWFVEKSHDVEEQCIIVKGVVVMEGIKTIS